MSQWISVEDRLPDLKGLQAWQSSIEVIVFTEDGQVMAANYASNEYAGTAKGKIPRWERNGRIAQWRITHWQPLPEPPK